MNLKDFDYELPKELIAQVPLKERTSSRLMVVNREKGTVENKTFTDLIDYLDKGDLLVLNNTRVIPARLYGTKKETGAAIEFLLLKRLSLTRWEVILKPGKKAKPGAEFVFGDGTLSAKIIDFTEDGGRIVEFSYEGVFEEILDRFGQMPLPPYITEKLEDRERYQTVYAKFDGSAAAPTAGLHFTDAFFEKIKEKGVGIAFVTLHVGLGTFRPVKCENILEHKMHTEHYFINEETAAMVNETKERGGKIVAVGTTSVRVLETAADENGRVSACEGDTDIFIYPGYKFKAVDRLVTNFHLPQSTLLMLISALYNREKILEAYEEAIKEKYRFFSFGDAMFIQ